MTSGYTLFLLGEYGISSKFRFSSFNKYAKKSFSLFADSELKNVSHNYLNMFPSDFHLPKMGTSFSEKIQYFYTVSTIFYILEKHP